MSKLCYVHVFSLHHTLYTTNCTQRSWIYTKIDLQQLNSLHAPKLNMGFKGIIYTTAWNNLWIREHYLYNTRQQINIIGHWLWVRHKILNPFLFTKILNPTATVCIRATSPFRVGKIILYMLCPMQIIKNWFKSTTNHAQLILFLSPKSNNYSNKPWVNYL